MKAKDYRQLSVSQLNDELIKSFNERMQYSLQRSRVQQPVAPHLIAAVRKRIARIKTILKEKGEA